MYSFGGFTLPFLVVASVALVNSIALAIVVPKIEITKKEEGETQTTRLTFSALIRVRGLFHVYVVFFLYNLLCFNGLLWS